jgi:hypothetical protein
MARARRQERGREGADQRQQQPAMHQEKSKEATANCGQQTHMLMVSHGVEK